MIEFDFSRIVPKFLMNDRNGYAMAMAINAALTIYCDVIEQAVRILNDVDSMPEWRLDEYAWEYGILWYDATGDIEEKRNQIRNANIVYRTLGTKGGVLDAVKNIFGEGSIEEWYQYDGDPYHYKIYVTDDSALYARNKNFLRLLSFVPNVRSVLDSVEVRGAKSNAPVHTATKFYAGYYTMSATAR